MNNFFLEEPIGKKYKFIGECFFYFLEPEPSENQSHEDQAKISENEPLEIAIPTNGNKHKIFPAKHKK